MSTTSAPPAPCPPWCSDHFTESGSAGWCNTETVEIAGSHIGISNGTNDGDVRLLGLGGVEDHLQGLDLVSAEKIARLILTLTQAAGLTSDDQRSPDQADVDALRDLLDLMANFSDNDQRARYLLSSNWMRDHGALASARLSALSAVESTLK